MSDDTRYRQSERLRMKSLKALDAGDRATSLLFSAASQQAFEVECEEDFQRAQAHARSSERHR